MVLYPTLKFTLTRSEQFILSMHQHVIDNSFNDVTRAAHKSNRATAAEWSVSSLLHLKIGVTLHV